MTLAAGVRLGPYEILAPIGAGGMGEVYRARDERLKRDVAIKVLPASFSADADRLRRFEQEAQAAGVLNHPNITAVYDIGSHEGAPYVVQELLEGETLRAELAGGRFSPRKAIEYATQIAHGLSAAHDKGIVHRDLKPENLFVTKHGRVKILDFGLAKLTQPDDGSGPQTNLPTVSAGTEPGVVMGTLGYMSPEQVKGKPAGPLSDIFAFGAIFYEMLSGKRAFHADSAGETMAAILKEDPPDLSVTNQDISPGLERIVRHCLEKNPERRFHSAHDLAFDLEALSSFSATGVASGALAARRRIPIGKMAAVAVALAAVAAAFFLGRRLNNRPLPGFSQLTFQRGTVVSARFAPDGQTVFYSATWEGKPIETFATRIDLPGPHPLGLPSAMVQGVSSGGDMLLTLDPKAEDSGVFVGAYARAPIAGGSPKPIAADVRGVDCLSDGKTCALVRLSGGRYRLELPPGKVLLESSGYISHARLSRDGRHVAFLDHPVRHDDRGFVAVTDLGGKTRRLTGQWGGSELGLAWSPDGKEIWFTASEAGPALSLYGVDLSGRQRLVYRMAGGVMLYDTYPDGRVLLSRSDRVHWIIGHGAGDSAEHELTWRNASELADISADGRQVLVLEWSEAAGPLYETCLQGIADSSLLRLGKGAPAALSPDGKWAISVLRSSTPEMQILPVGPGDPKKLPRGSIEQYHQFADWLPDGKSILFSGSELGHAPRIYIQGIVGDAPRPVTPEGVFFSTTAHPISPDGKLVAVFGKDGLGYVYPIAGGQPRPIPRLTTEEADIILRWTSDGRSIFVKKSVELPLRIWRVDVASGARELYKEIRGYDPAGLRSVGSEFQITPDGKAYAYDYARQLENLYVVEGLK